jgi:proton glutamate symport protein
MSATSRVTIALIVGLTLGALVEWTGSHAGLVLVNALEPLGTLWVNAIRMTVVPLVVALVIRALAGSEQSGSVGRLGARTAIAAIVGLIALAIAVAVTAPPMFRWLRLDPDAVAALRASAATAAPASTPLPTLKDWLISFVPVNPIRSAADSAMLPLLVFVVAFACGLRRIEPRARLTVVATCEGVAQAMLQVVRWVLALAPIGVLALTASIGAKLGVTAAGAVGFFLLVVCTYFLAATVGLYPLAAFGGRGSIRRFATGVAPAQAVAFSSRSSLASLPALIDGAVRVGVPVRVSGFVLPMAVAMFKFTQPIAWLVGTAFVTRLYGVNFDIARITTVALASVVLSFAAPGIPSGGLFMLAPIYMATGIPVEGIGVLIALDAVPDMFKTVGNVTGDMALAAVVGYSIKSGADGVTEPDAAVLREPVHAGSV